MEKGPARVGKSMCISRASLLPPKIPIPSIGQSYAEYVPSFGYGSRLNEKAPHHRRTSSESLLVVEKPSWFDELLDEPETLVWKGSHQRSSSDSSAYSGKPSPSETDTRSPQQQFAQHARVRKRLYIAKLEKNVQALEAETTGASAKLEFIKHQKLILDIENKALKQRLESLTQKQHIQYIELEALQREAARLRALYRQQQSQRFIYRRR